MHFFQCRTNVVIVFDIQYNSHYSCQTYLYYTYLIALYFYNVN